MVERRQMMQGQRRHDAVHRCRGEGVEARDVALRDDDVVEPVLGDVRAGALEHRRREIDSGEADPRIERRDLAELGRGSATEIDDLAAALDDLADAGRVKEVRGGHEPVDPPASAYACTCSGSSMTRAGSGSRGN